MYIIIGILVFGLLIFIHELGHYSVARFCNIKIDEFSIGIGPKLTQFTKGETLYAIRCIPLGGYVKMDGEDSTNNNERSFYNKPAWQRLLVMISGAFMNILLGFILVLYLVSSSDKLTDMTIISFNDESISNHCGLQEGDKILKINNHKLKVRRDFNYILADILDEKINMVIERKGEIINLSNVKLPFVEDKESGIKVHFVDFELGTKDKTVIGVIKYTYNCVMSDIKNVYILLKGLINGKYNVKMLSGPVQTATMIGDVSSYGFKSLINFISLITINLGIFNLLPLPALDGGKAIFILIEILTQKRLKPEWEGYIHAIGFILLMLLSVFVFYNDIVKLIHRYGLNNLNWR